MAFTPSMIQWHEGMFLSPQHFQQLQRRFEGLLGEHLEIHHKYFYGVLDLKFDPLTLPTGILRIESIRGIMPDGIFLDYPNEGGDQPLQIDLTPFKSQAASSPIRVYLCVPEMIRDHSPVIGEWPRYNSVDGNVTGDENLQDNVITIPRLVPKISLQVADTYPARYTSIPVAELVYQDESFILTSFIPPTLMLTPEHNLHIRASTIAQRIREKSLFLSEKWQKQIGTTLLNETANQLRPLIQILPRMEAFLRNQSFHPFDLYLFMSEVMGDLAGMRLAQVPPLLMPYQHDRLGDSFRMLFDMVESYMDSVEQSVIVIPFTATDRLFHLKIHESYLSQEVLIGIKAPITMDEDELYEWVKDAVIACDSMVESARVRRIIGASRSVLDQEDMSEFLTGRGTLVFKLDTSSDFIKGGESLNIFNVSDTDAKRPHTIVLYLKKQKPIE